MKTHSAFDDHPEKPPAPAQVCIENFINGNLGDAKRQAKRISRQALVNWLEGYYFPFFKSHKSQKIADYLKHPSQATFQAACDAQ